MASGPGERQLLEQGPAAPPGAGRDPVKGREGRARLPPSQIFDPLIPCPPGMVPPWSPVSAWGSPAIGKGTLDSGLWWIWVMDKKVLGLSLPERKQDREMLLKPIR